MFLFCADLLSAPCYTVIRNCWLDKTLCVFSWISVWTNFGVKGLEIKCSSKSTPQILQWIPVPVHSHAWYWFDKWMKLEMCSCYTVTNSRALQVSALREYTPTENGQMKVNEWECACLMADSINSSRGKALRPESHFLILFGIIARNLLQHLRTMSINWLVFIKEYQCRLHTECFPTLFCQG